MGLSCMLETGDSAQLRRKLSSRSSCTDEIAKLSWLRWKGRRS